MELGSSTISSDSLRTLNTNFSSANVEIKLFGPSGIQRLRKTSVLTERLSAAFEPAKVSDRQVVDILMTCADALGVSLLSAVLSRSSVHIL